MLSLVVTIIVIINIIFIIIIRLTLYAFFLYFLIYFSLTDMDHAKRKPLRILYCPYLQLCGVATKTSRFVVPLKLPPP